MAFTEIQNTNNREFGQQTIINAVAAAGGAGTTYVLPFMCSKFTVVFSYTGTPTAVSDVFQGSLDNSTWFDLHTNATAAGATVHVVYKPVKYIRGNVGAMTGGSSPKSTIKVAGARV